MIRAVIITCASVIFMFFVSGCTDFVEPNQLAFVMGTAVDHVDNGNIEISHQIVIPSQMNGTSKGSGSGDSDSFLVMSAKGRDVLEANQKIQREISRKLLTSHRIIIAISEDFFIKNEVDKIFDKLGRDPANNQRDITVMIRGKSAKEFLMTKNPLENLSSIAVGKEMNINGMKKYSTRQFVIDSVAQDHRPLVPVLQMKNTQTSKNKKDLLAVLSGFAVLNNELKIGGVLDDLEGNKTAWMSGKDGLRVLTIPWKDGKGSLSFRLTHLNREMKSAAGPAPTQVAVTARAQAYLLENTTQLDMSEVGSMLEVQQYLNEKVSEELQLTFNKVQSWGTDVFSIGAYLHHKYPAWWRLNKEDWDEHFKQIHVVVQANIQFKSIGATGGQIKRGR
ncbi:Ger(x)C family spore germination protein [Paenibacillus anseongense]|uniref:Ger(x)C family spore germination protein n=1 Tax=Paenibacillus anseongense TaxID=2682845 RepID=UPI002DC03141|nr:Ger(x)C family spore germination protein [Paenibacillus anseongense]MEC0265105.1 Ger(x)C family spore germination protein [Paenibacillus anseongense]